MKDGGEIGGDVLAVDAVTLPLIGAVPGVRHAFTTRSGGCSTGAYASLNLGISAGDRPADVLENRRRAAELVKAGGLVLARQVHGVTALVVDSAGEEGVPAGVADILITATPGLALLVLSADCVPLLAIDRTRGVIAAAHAGWRGTAKGAGGALPAELTHRFGCRPQDLVIAIGPSIRACCYEVGEEVAVAVSTATPAGDACLSRRGEGRPHLDLATALWAQLTAAGVPPDQIEISGLCSGCRPDLLYSHRMEGEPTGRFGALIALES